MTTPADIDAELATRLAALHDEVLDLYAAVKQLDAEHRQECVNRATCDFRTTLIVGITNMIRHKDPTVLAVYVADILTQMAHGRAS